MMMLILFMFSLVFVQGVSTYLADGSTDYHDHMSNAMLTERFGSIGDSILSLYLAITGGQDWGEVYKVISPIGPMYSYVFLGFIGFCQISLLNILTGIFVENALTHSQPTKEQLALEKHKEEFALNSELQRQIEALDPDGDGRVPLDDFFLGVVGSPLHVYLDSIDVSVQELKDFVKLFCANKKGETGERTISVQSLIHGCTLVRGNARNLDMQRVLVDLKGIRHDQDEILRILDTLPSIPNTPCSARSEEPAEW